MTFLVQKVRFADTRMWVDLTDSRVIGVPLAWFTGKPDLNKMHTSIDMGTNDLNNTGTVNAGSDVNAGGGVTAAGNIRSTGGWLVNRGNCWLASDSLVIASARQHPWADVDLMAE